MTTLITPALLDRLSGAIAAGLGMHYPHNVWMVVPDPALNLTGGYGFIVLTRPWDAPAQPTNWTAQAALLSGPPPVPTPLPIVMARPFIADIMADPDDAVFRLISCLIVAFSNNSACLAAGPVHEHEPHEHHDEWGV